MKCWFIFIDGLLLFGLLIIWVGMLVVVVCGGIGCSIMEFVLIFVLCLILILLRIFVFVLIIIFLWIFGWWLLLDLFVLLSVIDCRIDMLFLIIVVLLMMMFVVWLSMILWLIFVVGWILIWNVIEIWFCRKIVSVWCFWFYN